MTGAVTTAGSVDAACLHVDGVIPLRPCGAVTVGTITSSATVELLPVAAAGGGDGGGGEAAETGPTAILLLFELTGSVWSRTSDAGTISSCT